MSALAVVSLSAWLLWRTQHALPADPLAAVPDDAYAVLGVRVERVLASQAWQRLVVERGEARGIQRVTATCGFNPLAGIAQLTAFVRAADRERAPRFAFLARGKLPHAQLIDCVRKLGGRDGLKLVREDIEGIQTMRSQQGSSRVAFVGSDAVMGGDADSVREAILAMRGKRGSLAADAGLRGLYQELSAEGELVAVVNKPAQLLPLLGKLGSLVDPSLLALDKLLLAGARVTLQPESIAGSGSLITQTPDQARQLAEVLTSQRDRVLDFPLLGLTGLTEPLRSARITAEGPRTRVTTTIKLRVAEALLDLLVPRRQP